MIALLLGLAGFSGLASPGVSAWRTPGRDGKACSSCHSPDGIELVWYGFDEANLTRRASAHLTSAELSAVVGFVFNQRSQLKDAPLNAQTDRPLQPGGQPLPGPTAEQRDVEFQQRLAREIPVWSGPDIESLSMAIKARDQILNVDLFKLPIGIALNRISEDGFHGKEHATIAHWIPDVSLPFGPTVYRAQDEYLSDPTDANLRHLDEVVNQTVGEGNDPTERLARIKYRSLLTLQHQMRTGRLVLLKQNPFWEMAEFGRLYAGNSVSDLAVPPELEARKQGGPTTDQQLKDLRLPWYWLGWALDPGLQRIYGVRQTSRADYFTKTLWSDGPYPAHALFMITRKQLEQGFNPQMWVLKSPQRFEIQYSFLLLGNGLTTHEPVLEPSRSEFRHLAANSFRMSMWLLLDSVTRSGRAYRPESQLLQVKLMSEYLRQIHQMTRTDQTLADRLTANLKKAGREL